MIPVLGFLLETAQHRALVPFYLVIWAGATSLCAEGREGWQDKAPLPLGASISSFRPLSFVSATSASFWRRGSLSTARDPPFSYSTVALSPPLPQRAEEMLCGVPCVSERNDNIPEHWSWQPPSCQGPWLFSPIGVGHAGWLGLCDRSTLLLAQPQELGGQCHPRCHWRREEKDYHGHFTLH